MDDLEKEAKQKEYSPEYISELLDAVRQYVPPHVMDTLHRKALPRAGGKASAKARAAQAQSQSADTQAATEAHQAQDTQAEVNAEVNKQPLPSGVNEDDEDDDDDDNGNAQTPKKSKGKMTKEEIEKALTATDKAKLSAEINSKSTADLTAYHRRLHQQAAQGNVLTGFSQSDMTSFHNQIEQKLKDKADAKGDKSSAGSPLTFGKATKAESDDDEDIDKCHFGTVDDIRERESKKSAEKSIEKQSDGDKEDLHPDCLKVARQCMQMKKEKSKKSVKKSDVPTFIGKRPILTFVAASPGSVEYIRKSALVGATGKTFNDEYLTPLGLTRDNVAITYLVPQLLKDESGKVREPTVDEINSWQPWFRDELAKVESGSKSKAKVPIIALGHTVKKALERDVEFTMPHPNSLYTPRTKDELQRKRLQVSKALEARYRKN